MCEEWRDLFNAGAETAQSAEVDESCFSKTFAEPSEGGGVALTKLASGKS